MVYEALLARFTHLHGDQGNNVRVSPEWDTRDFMILTVTKEYFVRKFGMKVLWCVYC